MTVEVAPGLQTLRVDARRGGASTHWNLPLQSSRRPGWARKAEARFEAGEIDAMLELLEPHLWSSRVEERALAWRWKAWGIFSESGVDEAEEHLRRAIEFYDEAGYVSSRILYTAVLCSWLIEQRRFNEARLLLDALPDPRADSLSAFHIEFRYVSLARQEGDLRNALRDAQDLLARTERLGLNGMRPFTEWLIAKQLWLSGRFEESANLFDRLLAASKEDAPCSRANLLNSAAWHRLLDREAGRSARDPRPLLVAAREILASDCKSEAESLNVQMNLTLTDLQEGERGSCEESPDI